MNLKIKGLLFKRLKSLAVVLTCEPENLVCEVLRRGIVVMEREGLKPARNRVPENAAAFIEANYLEMDDDSLARSLRVLVGTVRSYRSSLGLKRERRKPYKKQESSIKISDLNQIQKEMIRDHPKMSHRQLGRKLACSSSLVKMFRKELAKGYVPAHYLDESDTSIGKRFGLNRIDIMRVRRSLKLLRIRGSQAGEMHALRKIPLGALGTRKEILVALAEDGKTLSELMREKGLPVTRERGRQIIADLGLTARVSNRKPIWYARRLLGPDRDELARKLSDKVSAKRLIAEAGSCNALAGKLELNPVTLGVLLRNRVGISLRYRSPTKKSVTYKCDSCHSTIRRPKNRQKVEDSKKHHFCNNECFGDFLRGKTRPVKTS